MGRITFYFVYTVQMFMGMHATLFVHEGTPGCVCVCVCSSQHLYVHLYLNLNTFYV